MKTNTNTKKEVEKRDLEIFIKYSKLPLIIVDKDRECPDFVVKYNGKTIAIEHTRYATKDDKKKSLTAWNKSQIRILEEARSQFNINNKNGNVSFTLGFIREQTTRMTCKQERELARRIAEFCNGLKLENIGVGTHSIPYTNFNNALRELNVICAHIYEGATDKKWHSCLGFESKLVEPLQLNQIIKNKFDKKSLYEKCDELWLLIVVDWFVVSLDCIMPWAGAPLNGVDKEGFDRVFLMNNAISVDSIDLRDFLIEV